jgi:hypothetical protein
MVTRDELATLARDALCLNEDDWGSDRQIAAFNRFNEAASAMMTEPQVEAWDRYSMKATSDEIVEEALRLLDMPSVTI